MRGTINIENLEDFKKQRDALTVALGKSMCGASKFCIENDCLDCVNCKGGKLSFRPIAVALYEQGVRADAVKINQAKNEALEKKAKELRQELIVTSQTIDRYKTRIEELNTRLGYTFAAEKVIDYFLLKSGCSGKCVNLKKCVFKNGVLSCPAIEANGKKACREGTIEYFAGGKR